MTSDTMETKARIVLDTNVIISAILFGGKPRQVLDTVLTGRTSAVISPLLLAELSEVMHKKFPFHAAEFEYIQEQIQSEFELIHPHQTIHILHDEPDNRVLEAALEGKCHYIITGDRELLALATYKKVNIITPETFLQQARA